MRLIRTLFVVAAGLALVAATPSTQAAEDGKKAKKEHHVKGVVAEIKKDADKDSGTITVKIPEHKNKKTGEVKPAEEKTFQVTDATKWLRVSGKKGALDKDPITFGQVKEGEHVVLEVKGDVVVEGAIHQHKKKNK